MATMVEKVAREVCKSLGYEPDETIRSGADMKKWETFAPVARAAIEAMRIRDGYEGDASIRNAAAQINAYLDGALAEG